MPYHYDTDSGFFIAWNAVLLSLSDLNLFSFLPHSILNSLVYATEIFQCTGLILQLLVETPSYFQSPVVFRSYQTANDLKSAVFQAVNCSKQTSQAITSVL